MKGGRRTEEEKLTAKCAGEQDPISLNDIEPKYAIRLTEGGHVFCFDVRSLEMLLHTGSIKNPLTNLDFSPQSLAKIDKKIYKLFELRKYDLEFLSKDISDYSFIFLRPGQSYEGRSFKVNFSEHHNDTGSSYYKMYVEPSNHLIFFVVKNYRVFRHLVKRVLRDLFLFDDETYTQYVGEFVRLNKPYLQIDP